MILDASGRPTHYPRFGFVPSAPSPGLKAAELEHDGAPVDAIGFQAVEVDDFEDYDEEEEYEEDAGQ